MGKLKRFLLRYDPPGIGLEVEDESGNVVVRHKNLPNALPPGNDQSSAKEIASIVDNLIGEEEVLTKRRHQPALMQLLGRLYKVEVDTTDTEAPESGPSPTGSGLEGFQEGMSVVLVGLKGKQQAFNGELGTLVKVKKDKFEVMVGANRSGADTDTLKVKGSEHVVAVAPKGTQLSVGVHVAIRGLRNHIELNGCLGRVVECHEETHRFEVRATESGQLFRVKQENLIPIECPVPVASAKENREPNISMSPRKKEVAGGVSAAAGADPVIIAPASDGVNEIFEPGTNVQLFGLKTAMVYNGQTAEVLSVDRGRGRYEIRLNDGSVKTIKAENVRLVAGPSKTSPRTRRKDGAGAGAGQSSKARG